MPTKNTGVVTTWVSLLVILLSLGYTLYVVTTTSSATNALYAKSNARNAMYQTRDTFLKFKDSSQTEGDIQAGNEVLAIVRAKCEFMVDILSNGKSYLNKSQVISVTNAINACATLGKTQQTRTLTLADINTAGLTIASSVSAIDKEDKDALERREAYERNNAPKRVAEMADWGI